MATIGLAELNDLDRQGFVVALGSIVDASPWVASLAYAARPFPDRAALQAAFRAALRAGSDAQKLALLMAQPGLLATAQSADLGGFKAHDPAMLEELDEAYRTKFGFPLVFAVKGASRGTVFEAVEARLLNDAPTELKNGLAELELITRFRLDERVTP